MNRTIFSMFLALAAVALSAGGASAGLAGHGELYWAAQSFKQSWQTHQVLPFGELRVRNQPDVPADVIREMKEAVAQGKYKTNDLVSLEDIQDGKVPQGVSLSYSLNGQADSSKGSKTSGAAERIMARFPRIVVGTKTLVSTVVQTELYPYFNGQTWEGYVVERWLSPMPHMDSWKKLTVRGNI